MITRYNAKDTAITVDGTFITGLGENMIGWSKDEAYFEPVVGAQGDIIKSEINNGIHTMTIAVQPTSPQLPLLMNLQGRSDTFPVWGINKSLGVRFGGEQASIKEAPEISLGASAEDLEFTITVFDGVTEAV